MEAGNCWHISFIVTFLKSCQQVPRHCCQWITTAFCSASISFSLSLQLPYLLHHPTTACAECDQLAQLKLPHQLCFFKITIFWDMTPCRTIVIYQHFKSTNCLQHHGTRWLWYDPQTDRKFKLDFTALHPSKRKAYHCENLNVFIVCLISVFLSFQLFTAM
jgi:hypothetical protein